MSEIQTTSWEITTMSVINATACDLFPRDQGYCDALVYSKQASASLSLVGSLFTLFVIWLFRKYSEFSQRLIVNLSVASLLLAACYLLTDMPSPGVMCTVQATWMSFANWAILLWIVTIVANLYTHVRWGKSLEPYERWVFLTCWGVPVLVAGLPFAGGVYGRAGAWCWIRNNWEWRLGTWYIWAIVSVVAITAVIIYTSCTLHRTSRHNVEDGANEAARKRQDVHNDAVALRIYPIVYFAVNIFSVINRIQQSVAGVDNNNFTMLLLQTMFGPFLGGAVAVAFVLDRRTLQVLKPTSIATAIRKRFAKKTVIREMDITRDT